MELDPLSHTTLKEIPLDFINAVSATRRNWEQRQKICRQVRKSTLDQCQPTPLWKDTCTANQRASVQFSLRYYSKWT
jgi:hypothetical protein